jgi:hypothetical protein
VEEFTFRTECEYIQALCFHIQRAKLEELLREIQSREATNTLRELERKTKVLRITQGALEV